MVHPTLAGMGIRRFGGWALFLDVDGTLLEIAETPQSVRVTAALRQLLVTLSFRLDGALALVSARTLNDLDHLFAPLRFCAAGVHGWERREVGGRVIRPQLDVHRLDSARERLRRFAENREGLLLEDKGHALAVHFRRAPHLSAEVRDAINAVWHELGTEFAKQEAMTTASEESMRQMKRSILTAVAFWAAKITATSITRSRKSNLMTFAGGRVSAAHSTAQL